VKKTLLQITQSILNDMDSDFVNSIDDTVEAQQVATIVKDCYEELIANRNWPHLKKLVQFDAVGTSKPVYMKLPDRVKEVISFKYNVAKLGETKVVYRDVKYLQPEEFLEKVNSRNSDLDNVIEVVDDSGISILVYNNKAPEYYTSFDDVYIICDSYNVEVDDALKKSKTQTSCYMFPSWEHSDDAYPDIPEEAFPLLLEEAKSTAFLVLKQMANQKAEQKAARQNRWLSRKAWSVGGGVVFSDYGRRSKK
jgi:hypothetical protein